MRSTKEEGVDFVQLLHYCHSIITIQNEIISNELL